MSKRPGKRQVICSQVYRAIHCALYCARGSPDAQSRHDQACRYNTQLQGVITDIRKLPGLSRFLQPTLFSELRISAEGGPIAIVNASKYGCDALIVLRDRDPTYIKLRITKSRVSDLSTRLHCLTLRAKHHDVSREPLELLRALWDEVVSPIVEILRTHCSHGSRARPPSSPSFHCTQLAHLGRANRLSPIFISLLTRLP